MENFKSIKHIEVEPSRINVFIGEPNSGKSNILDALGFLSALGNNPAHFPEMVRVRNFSEIYHYKKVGNPVVIATNFGGVAGIYRSFLPFAFINDKKTNTRVESRVVDVVTDNLKAELKCRDYIDEEVATKINGVLSRFGVHLNAEVYTFSLPRIVSEVSI